MKYQSTCIAVHNTPSRLHCVSSTANRLFGVDERFIAIGATRGQGGRRRMDGRIARHTMHNWHATLIRSVRACMCVLAARRADGSINKLLEGFISSGAMEHLRRH
ncbi:unnamed protein product [Strongylus vulgaris]|uniref:Uncharacterized protein n=1 Tax=Strongylus vulgaris TaxID=40348 RepID=A0A3P7KIC8_STRVU|nr:unnamed protein product [Strongylus vulgaris]